MTTWSAQSEERGLATSTSERSDDFRKCLLKQIDFRHVATKSSDWTGPGIAFQGGAAGISAWAISNITVGFTADEKEENVSEGMR